MKINFDASFKEIQRYLQTPAAPAKVEEKSTTGFASLLADISPDKPQLTETKGENLGPPLNRGSSGLDSSKGPMARFSFPDPHSSLPTFDKISPKPEQLADVKESPPGVKEVENEAPNMLAARRVRTPVKDINELTPEKRTEEVRQLIGAAGTKHGIDPALGMAVVAAESSFNPKAVSSDGHSSKGLFQLLDKTGQHFHEKLDDGQEYDPFDPQLNVELGVGYLRHLHDIFSSSTDLANKRSTVAAANSASLEKLAVAAFNAGEGRVASAQERAAQQGRDAANYDEIEGYLPESTQEYVQRVMGLKREYETTPVG